MAVADDGKYRVIITTANRAAAGIASPVYIKMHGERGTVRPLEVRAQRDCRPRSPAAKRTGAGG